MTRILKRIQAFLFSVLFLVGSSHFVSAEIIVPNCTTTLSTSVSTLSRSDGSVGVSINPAGLQDDTRFRVVYSATGDQSDVFDRYAGPFSHNFNFSFDQVVAGPQSIYLESGGQRFCNTTLLFDSKADRVNIGKSGAGNPPESFDICQQAGTKREMCDQCFDNNQIWTGVGCIPFDTSTGTIRAFITLGLGVTGTAVVLTTLYAGFMFSTSQGDPKRVDEAKSAITSAIIGAFFIIFSVTILRFIGVSILHIPDFG